MSRCRCLLFATVVFTASGSFAAEPLRVTIDRRVSAAWAKHKITPAKPASDAEFLRRVTLDLLGRVPKYEETFAFLNDSDPKKREKLVDKLLADPRFGVHMADVWDQIYFGRNPPGFMTSQRGAFKKWLGTQFAKNTPYNVWTRKLLKAEGDTANDGPPMFFVQYHNKPEDATEAVTQKFLGVQLQCARCHDHPFDEWKQTDFYGVAAFLARLQVVTLKRNGRLSNFAVGEMNTGDVLFTGPAIDQKPGQKGTPISPKFLDGKPLKEPKLPKGFKDPRRFPNNKMPPKPKFSRKDALADWITDAKNPWFAKAAVNRIWAQFLGKGIVSPVDNLSANNPPSHPELLKELTEAFVAHKFDVKFLIREIVNSKAYQLSSAGSNSKLENPLWYERARYRPLSAEELYESWILASGYKETRSRRRSNGDPRFSSRALSWSYVRRYFGKPADGVGNFQGGMHEHLFLNNGQVHSLISRRSGLFPTLAKSKDPWDKRVERLYLQVLSRKPTAEETKKFVAFLSAKDNGEDRLHEAIWTLLTCGEFRFNH